MKSVLISVDFVKDQNGNLRPTELNTSTVPSLRLNEYPLTIENFESNFNGIFNHQGLYNFVTSNNINKIVVINNSMTSDVTYLRVFCEFYNLTFENIKIENDQPIPDLDDDETTLFIRIAFDPFALIDDLYARDNFEFYNLIVSESFFIPTSFNTELGLDSLPFESPQDEFWPNYILKPRTPGYSFNEYPVLYQFSDETQLNNKKTELKDSEFLSKYIINSGSLSEKDGRTVSYRNMSLIAGSDLHVIDLINYKEYNQISVDNELLIYDTPILEQTKELDKLHSTRFIPYTKIVRSFTFHFDETDVLIKSDDTLISASVLFDSTDGVEMKTINYLNDIKENLSIHQSEIDNFIFTTSSINRVTEKEKPGIFVNVTTFHEEYGEFSWYDGESNPYLLQKSGSEIIEFSKMGSYGIGDYVYSFDINKNKHIPLKITNITYEIKDYNTYFISLNPDPLFFIQLTNEEHTKDTSNLFLIQHNACIPDLCLQSNFSATCNSTCIDCGKNSTDCIQCGGSDFLTCSDPFAQS